MELVDSGSKIGVNPTQQFNLQWLKHEKDLRVVELNPILEARDIGLDR
jgi:hypothetical protein